MSDITLPENPQSPNTPPSPRPTGPSSQDRSPKILSSENLGVSQGPRDEKRWEEIRLQVAQDSWNERFGESRRIGYSTLQPRDFGIRFDALDQKGEHLPAMRDWTPQLRHGYYLYGDVGSGKSTLCKALVNKFASPGYLVRFERVGAMLDRLRATMGDEGKGNLEVEMERLKKCSLLILDDLGPEQLTEWVGDKLFQIIDDRLTNGLHIFVTSNLGPVEAAKKYGPRISDRLRAMVKPLLFTGGSFRGRNDERFW